MVTTVWPEMSFIRQDGSFLTIWLISVVRMLASILVQGKALTNHRETITKPSQTMFKAIGMPQGLLRLWFQI